MIGRKATLNSGGPLMTIMWKTMKNNTAGSDVHYYTCGWFNDGEFKEAKFPPSSLRIAQEEK